MPDKTDQTAKIDEKDPPLRAPQALQADKPDEAGGGVARRTVFQVGALGVTGAAALSVRSLWVPGLSQRGLWSPDGAFAAASTALGDTVFFTEVFPISPLILSPFTDPLPVPKPL